MKIVVADDLPASALDLLRAEAGWQVDARSGRSPAELAADLADADALLVRSATKVDADAARRGAAAADRRAAPAPASTTSTSPPPARRGILVVNAPGANSISVAEHACALMLALARAVPAADRAMKDGKWEKKRFLGTELRGKTLGIAGLGRIGQEVAQRARARSACGSSPTIRSSRARSPAAIGVELLSLDELCATRRLPDAAPAVDARDASICSTTSGSRRCKPGIRIINTARGELIDEAALRRAIDSGHRRRRRRSTCSRRSRRPTGRSRSCRRSSRRRTSPRRPKKRRNWSVSTPRRRSAISCATASSATP